MQRKLIVLDRDGVINRESPDFIRTPAQWLPIDGSLAAIARLCRGGFTVVVATNQSGVGRGYFDLDTLAAIHARMRAAVAEAGGVIDGIFVCPHRPDEGCDCRKPLPGLFRQIEHAYACSLTGQPAVGDSGRDLEAACRVGARPILVRTGNGLKTEKLEVARGVEVHADLAAVADALLNTPAPAPGVTPQ